MADRDRKKLGEVLVKGGFITKEQLDGALKEQQVTKKRIGTVLIEKGILTGKQICVALGYQLGVPFMDLKTTSLDPDVVKLIPKKIAEQKMLIAVGFEDNILTVACADPLDLLAMDDVKAITHYNVRPVIAIEADISNSIERYYSLEKLIYESIGDIRLEKGMDIIEEKAGEGADREYAPVVKLLNHIFNSALIERASDIHVEPEELSLKIRFRVDGILIDKFTFPKHLQQILVSRIKIISNLNIAEKRKPQDGRCKLKLSDREIDMRISTLPLLYGEKVVIRLLDKTMTPLKLESLGMLPDTLELMGSLLKSTKGLLFVAGPTGSGKTTTLYSAINYIKTREKNIVTIEDPIEYDIEGVNQMQINEKAGILFSNGLRSILRQDPDIILVGEVRDKETAEIAFEAALTGRLVLSTLHTNNAPSSLIRLIKLGVKPFLIGEVVVGVVAQRLVRNICVNCKTEKVLDKNISELLKLKDSDLAGKKFFYGKGCKECNFTGYRGRSAIFEILRMDRKIASQLNASLTSETMYNISKLSGMKTLAESGLELVFSGRTSLEEIARVIYVEMGKMYICPKCHKGLEESFVMCPYCGEELSRLICSVCGKPQNIDWLVCPYCKTAKK